MKQPDNEKPGCDIQPGLGSDIFVYDKKRLPTLMGHEAHETGGKGRCI